MGRRKKIAEEDIPRATRPASNPESRENQLISLAVDLAEKQLREGTASSQVITHFLKLGTTVARLEREKLKHENELLEAKTASLKRADKIEELYANAIAAMNIYRGADEDEDD